jgi:hypothetical protein
LFLKNQRNKEKGEINRKIRKTKERERLIEQSEKQRKGRG